jgi:predicted nucleic acid-binding protein
MRTAPKRSFAYRLHVAEPRSAYLHRPPLVTDASVIAAALFGEASRAESVALLHGRTLHAPHLLDHEIASVALKKLRRGNLSREVVAAALQAYARLPIERHAVDAETVVAVAARCGLTAYDAAYLHVAEQLTAPLATLDNRLATAARSYLATDREVHEPE